MAAGLEVCCTCAAEVPLINFALHELRCLGASKAAEAAQCPYSLPASWPPYPGSSAVAEAAQPAHSVETPGNDTVKLKGAAEDAHDPQYPGTDEELAFPAHGSKMGLATGSDSVSPANAKIMLSDHSIPGAGPLGDARFQQNSPEPEILDSLPDTDDELVYPSYRCKVQPSQPFPVPTLVCLWPALYALPPPLQSVHPVMPPPPPPPLVHARVRVPDRRSAASEIAAFKASAHYRAGPKLPGRPLTPDPHDRRVEAIIYHWQRQWSGRQLHHGSSGGHAGKVDGISSLVRKGHDEEDTLAAWDKAGEDILAGLIAMEQRRQPRANRGVRSKELLTCMEVRMCAEKILHESAPHRILSLSLSEEKSGKCTLECTNPLAGEQVATLDVSYLITPEDSAKLPARLLALIEQRPATSPCKLRVVLQDGSIVNLESSGKNTAFKNSLEERRIDLFLEGRAVTYKEMCAGMPGAKTADELLARWSELKVERAGIVSVRSP